MSRRMSNWKTDLISATVTAALYMSIPGDLTRAQSFIYIALYYGIVRVIVEKT